MVNTRNVPNTECKSSIFKASLQNVLHYISPNQIKNIDINTIISTYQECTFWEEFVSCEGEPVLNHSHAELVAD